MFVTLCEYDPIKKFYATVAQLVEQRIRNAQAVGSSPTSSSRQSLNAVVRSDSFLFT